MPATVQDILDKIDLLEMDRSNIRRAIIAKDVYVPTDATVTPYGDYIRMINPDIELEYVYTYQDTGPQPYDFCRWTYEDLRPDLGIKPVMQLGENQRLDYVLYSNLWNSNPATVVMSNTPYTGSTIYHGYNLNFFEIRAEKWTSNNVDTITTGTPAYYSVAKIWPSLDASTYNYYYKTRNSSDSHVDPRTSFRRSIWYPDDVPSNSITISCTPHIGQGDSLDTFNLDKTSNLCLDFNGCTYHGDGTYPPVYNENLYKNLQVRRGYSQKFSKLIINKVSSFPHSVKKLHEFVPYIRFNPVTGKYDQFVIKDKMNPQNPASLIKWPWFASISSPTWLQTKPEIYTYDYVREERVVSWGPTPDSNDYWFSFRYRLKS